MNRRTFWPVSAPWPRRPRSAPAPPAITPELIEAARKEGSVTWYIAQVDTQTAEVWDAPSPPNIPA